MIASSSKKIEAFEFNGETGFAFCFDLKRLSIHHRQNQIINYLILFTQMQFSVSFFISHWIQIKPPSAYGSWCNIFCYKQKLDVRSTRINTQMINGCGFVFKHPQFVSWKYWRKKKNEIIYQQKQAYRMNRLVGMRYVNSTLHGVYRPHKFKCSFHRWHNLYIIRFDVNTREKENILERLWVRFSVFKRKAEY